MQLNVVACIFLYRFEQMIQRKYLTKEQALQKLKHYCGYQERSHSEVKEKLYSLGVGKKDHDEIISTLIEENYLNEERFAIAFAGGKFRNGLPCRVMPFLKAPLSPNGLKPGLSCG